MRIGKPFRCARRHDSVSGPIGCVSLGVACVSVAGVVRDTARLLLVRHRAAWTWDTAQRRAWVHGAARAARRKRYTARARPDDTFPARREARGFAGIARIAAVDSARDREHPHDGRNAPTKAVHAATLGDRTIADLATVHDLRHASALGSRTNWGAEKLSAPRRHLDGFRKPYGGRKQSPRPCPSAPIGERNFPR